MPHHRGKNPKPNWYRGAVASWREKPGDFARGRDRDHLNGLILRYEFILMRLALSCWQMKSQPTRHWIADTYAEVSGGRESRESLDKELLRRIGRDPYKDAIPEIPPILSRVQCQI